MKFVVKDRLKGLAHGDSFVDRRGGVRISGVRGEVGAVEFQPDRVARAESGGDLAQIDLVPPELPGFEETLSAASFAEAGPHHAGNEVQ